MVLQALACGCPVIVTENTGAADIVRENNCGLLVEPTDPDSIAGAIIKLLSNPKLIKDMGNNGRMAVENQYNWKKESDKLLDFYNKIQANDL